MRTKISFFFAIFSSFVHYFFIILYTMIAWSNVKLLVEVPPLHKKGGPKFVPHGPKSDPKLGFLSLFQVWVIRFPGDCLGA